MGATRFYDLDVRAAVAAGDAVDVSRFGNKWIQVKGSGWTATLQVQGRMAGGAWTQIGTNITAANIGDLIELAPLVQELRINTSAFTAGVPAISFGGESTHL